MGTMQVSQRVTAESARFLTACEQVQDTEQPLHDAAAAALRTCLLIRPLRIKAPAAAAHEQALPERGLLVLVTNQAGGLSGRVTNAGWLDWGLVLGSVPQGAQLAEGSRWRDCSSALFCMGASKRDFWWCLSWAYEDESTYR